MKIIGDSIKDMFSNLLMMVMSIVQKVQTMNPTPLTCVDPQLLLTMGNPLLAPSSSQAPQLVVMALPPYPTVSPTSILESQPRTPQISTPIGIQSPRPVAKPGISSHE